MIDNVLLRVQMQAGYAGKPVLRDIRFELKHGEVLGLVGTSGAGKSTLVQSLLGLLPWRGGQVTGEVCLDGKNLLALSERELRKLRGRTLLRRGGRTKPAGARHWKRDLKPCSPKCNCLQGWSSCADGHRRSALGRHSACSWPWLCSTGRPCWLPMSPPVHWTP